MASTADAQHYRAVKTVQCFPLVPLISFFLIFSYHSQLAYLSSCQFRTNVNCVHCINVLSLYKGTIEYLQFMQPSHSTLLKL